MNPANASGGNEDADQASSSTDAPPVALDEKSHIHSDLLRYASPEWLRKLTFGIKVYFAAVVANIGLWIILNIAVANGSAWVATSNMIYWLLPLISVVGVWQMTTPDPAGVARKSVRRARELARWGMCLSLAVSLMNAVLWWFAGAHGPGVDELGFVQFATDIFVWMALAWYVSALARRTPRQRLATHCRTLARLLGVIFALYLVFGGIETCINYWQTTSPASSTGVGGKGDLSGSSTLLYLHVFILVLLMTYLFLWLWGLILLACLNGKIKYARRFALRRDDDVEGATNRALPIES